MPNIERYGVKEQTSSADEIARAIEQIKLLGFAVVSSGLAPDEIEKVSDAFVSARAKMETKFGGKDELEKIDEHNTIRVPMLYERQFLNLALNSNILELCKRMMGDYFVLNQQNGISNPSFSGRYNQAAFHRDLPYQHFVSDRPLAINALFCLDDFTTENGATLVIPGTHKQAAFPSDAIAEAVQQQITAPAGSFIVLDCMLYHSGATNKTELERRAVNHVYSIPLLKQQIELPDALGENFTNDPDVRQLLGYGISTPRSVEEYYKSRQK